MNPTSSYIISDESLGAALEFLAAPKGNPQEQAQTLESLANILHSRSESLNNLKNMSLFAMGGIISKLKQIDGDGMPLWKLLPAIEEWWTFGDFVKHRLNIHGSTGFRMEATWIKAQQVKMLPQEVQRLGLQCSLKLLALSKTRQDIDFWLDIYEDCETKGEFVAKLIEQNGQKKIAKADIVRRQFNISSEESNFFDETLNIAQEDTGRVIGVNWNASEALVYILTCYRQWRAEKE